MDPERVRLDRWLWAARFYKTRALARQAIETGKVEVGGQRAKPSRSVRIGDALVVVRGDERFEVEALGLSAFLRLTGGKGLHVVVPVVPGPRWPSVKRFARTFVNEIVREDSGRFTPLMAKNRRGGKIFLDYLRNDRESTAIASYSPRARAGAPVALPIEWDELDRDADAAPRYGLLEVPAVVRRRKRDPWADFEAARRSLVD